MTTIVSTGAIGTPSLPALRRHGDDDGGRRGADPAPVASAAVQAARGADARSRLLAKLKAAASPAATSLDTRAVAPDTATGTVLGTLTVLYNWTSSRRR
jgi:hypothetical protein